MLSHPRRSLLVGSLVLASPFLLQLVEEKSGLLVPSAKCGRGDRPHCVALFDELSMLLLLAVFSNLEDKVGFRRVFGVRVMRWAWRLKPNQKVVQLYRQARRDA